MPSPAALLAKYTPAAVTAGRPLAVLGVDGVVVLEGETRVPARLEHLSARGKWVRDLQVPDGTREAVAHLARRYGIVWASEWGPNAHLALTGVLGLPAAPWPYLPVQFNKLAAIREYAAGRPWVWIDDPVVDLDPLPGEPGGVIVRVDPARGLAGLDLSVIDEAVFGPAA
ncbi:hypothetical protein GBF35_28375 [Nonomuraea phyllanthi]|uniref:hypothetical protein n=1 Tax=Nonomuraea phyllanthi TaxID=2219224 RepID=UPI0012932445|nr:hypothetical protein [Nonomuraea phyllanthi]QFY10036.1 hypothetical protein GBF35_28375 [Nonomuraea phyllanthi]